MSLYAEVIEEIIGRRKMGRFASLHVTRLWKTSKASFGGSVVKSIEKEQFCSSSGFRGAKFWVSCIHIYTHRHMHVVGDSDEKTFLSCYNSGRLPSNDTMRLETPKSNENDNLCKWFLSVSPLPCLLSACTLASQKPWAGAFLWDSSLCISHRAVLCLT